MKLSFEYGFDLHRWGLSIGIDFDMREIYIEFGPFEFELMWNQR